jgi:hypothetical protein
MVASLEDPDKLFEPALLEKLEGQAKFLVFVLNG